MASIRQTVHMVNVALSLLALGLSSCTPNESKSRGSRKQSEELAACQTEFGVGWESANTKTDPGRFILRGCACKVGFSYVDHNGTSLCVPESCAETGGVWDNDSQNCTCNDGYEWQDNGCQRTTASLEAEAKCSGRDSPGTWVNGACSCRSGYISTHDGCVATSATIAQQQGCENTGGAWSVEEGCICVAPLDFDGSACSVPTSVRTTCETANPDNGQARGLWSDQENRCNCPDTASHRQGNICSICPLGQGYNTTFKECQAFSQIDSATQCQQMAGGFWHNVQQTCAPISPDAISTFDFERCEQDQFFWTPEVHRCFVTSVNLAQLESRTGCDNHGLHWSEAFNRCLGIRESDLVRLPAAACSSRYHWLPHLSRCVPEAMVVDEPTCSVLGRSWNRIFPACHHLPLNQILELDQQECTPPYSFNTNFQKCFPGTLQRTLTEQDCRSLPFTWSTEFAPNNALGRCLPLPPSTIGNLSPSQCSLYNMQIDSRINRCSPITTPITTRGPCQALGASWNDRDQVCRPAHEDTFRRLGETACVASGRYYHEYWDTCFASRAVAASLDANSCSAYGLHWNGSVCLPQQESAVQARSQSSCNRTFADNPADASATSWQPLAFNTNLQMCLPNGMSVNSQTTCVTRLGKTWLDNFNMCARHTQGQIQSMAQPACDSFGYHWSVHHLSCMPRQTTITANNCGTVFSGEWLTSMQFCRLPSSINGIRDRSGANCPAASNLTFVGPPTNACVPVAPPASGSLVITSPMCDDLDLEFHTPFAVCGRHTMTAIRSLGETTCRNNGYHWDSLSGGCAPGAPDTQQKCTALSTESVPAWISSYNVCSSTPLTQIEAHQSSISCTNADFFWASRDERCAPRRPTTTAANSPCPPVAPRPSSDSRPARTPPTRIFTDRGQCVNISSLSRAQCLVYGPQTPTGSVNFHLDWHYAANANGGTCHWEEIDPAASTCGTAAYGGEQSFQRSNSSALHDPPGAIALHSSSSIPSSEAAKGVATGISCKRSGGNTHETTCKVKWCPDLVVHGSDSLVTLRKRSVRPFTDRLQDRSGKGITQIAFHNVTPNDRTEGEEVRLKTRQLDGEPAQCYWTNWQGRVPGPGNTFTDHDCRSTSEGTWYMAGMDFRHFAGEMANDQEELRLYCCLNTQPRPSRQPSRCRDLYETPIQRLMASDSELLDVRDSVPDRFNVFPETTPSGRSRGQYAAEFNFSCAQNDAFVGFGCEYLQSTGIGDPYSENNRNHCSALCCADAPQLGSSTPSIAAHRRRSDGGTVDTAYQGFYLKEPGWRGNKFWHEIAPSPTGTNVVSSLTLRLHHGKMADTRHSLFRLGLAPLQGRNLNSQTCSWVSNNISRLDRSMVKCSGSDQLVAGIRFTTQDGGSGSDGHNYREEMGLFCCSLAP